MATGYTYELTEVAGDSVTLKDFILKCARAFGPLAYLRDYDFNMPIPADLGFKEESSYRTDCIAEAEERIKELSGMSELDYLRHARQEVQSALAEYEERLKECHKTRARFQNMINQVSDWIPPSHEHDGLKEFMLSQLYDSMKHELQPSWYEEQIALRKDSLSPENLKKRFTEEVESAYRTLEYHRKNAVEEQAGRAYSIKWVKELLENVANL